MTFVELDLHKHYIMVCVLDATGAVLCEVRRMAVNAEELIARPAEFEKPCTVVMEATVYWQWLHDRLEATGHRVLVSGARQVKLIWQTRPKTDPIDARKLAD